MGMFSTKPPFDLTAFLTQKASPKASARRPAWKPKAAAQEEVTEEPDTGKE